MARWGGNCQRAIHEDPSLGAARPPRAACEGGGSARRQVSCAPWHAAWGAHAPLHRCAQGLKRSQHTHANTSCTSVGCIQVEKKRMHRGGLFCFGVDVNVDGT